MCDSPVTYAAVPDIVGVQIVRIVNGRGTTILRMQAGGLFENTAAMRRAVAAVLAAFEADQAERDAETVAGLPEEYR